MPKIRGIKPEFWTDEDIVDLSLPARLLFIGLWNLACDNGHVTDKPKQIKMRILPADDVDVDLLLDELADNGRIDRKAGTVTIRNFAKHQKPHRRWWTVCDLADCEIPEDAPEQGHNRGGAPSQTPPQPGTHRGATVDHGRTTADVDGEGEGDIDGEGDSGRSLTLAEPTTHTAQSLVAEWIDHCPDRPPSRVIGQVAKEIGSMLAEGIDYERVRAGLAEWNTRDVHPSVLASIVHGLANRKPRASSRRAEDEAMFERQMQRAIAREAGQA